MPTAKKYTSPARLGFPQDGMQPVPTVGFKFMPSAGLDTLDNAIDFDIELPGSKDELNKINM